MIFDIFNEPFGENVYADWMAPGGKDVSMVANGGTYSRFVTQNNSNNNALQLSIPVSGRGRAAATRSSAQRGRDQSRAPLADRLGG